MIDAIARIFGADRTVIILLLVAGGILTAAAMLHGMLRDYRDGQRAIGAAQTQQGDTVDVDAANKARACVQSCRLDGGVWDRTKGACLVAGLPRACR